MLGLRHGSDIGFQLAPDASFKIGQRVGMFSIWSIEADELIEIGRAHV